MPIKRLALFQDASDETPFFPTELYQVTVPENVEDYIVATVMVSEQISIRQEPRL